MDTLVAHTMDQVRQNLGLGPILALQVWCVAEDGEHVWVVMELLEQGWVGAEYFWYPRGTACIYSCRGAEKAPGSDGGGAAVMKREALCCGHVPCSWRHSLVFPFCGGPSAMRGPGWYCKRVSAVEDLDQEGWDRVK